MKMQALVFIHPFDLFKLVRSNVGPLDWSRYTLPNGLEVIEMNGIVYVETEGVPAVIVADWDVPAGQDLVEFGTGLCLNSH